MKHLETFIGAVLAGILIGLGGVVFLSCENKVVGAVFFSVGLLTIVMRGLMLFTGKVGYAVGQPISYLGFLAVVWLGNLVGTGIVGLAMRATRFAGTETGGLVAKATALWATKGTDSFVSIFILAIFCGLLMYLAVDTYKTQDNPFAKVVMIVFCVVVFILCGFEHCVANMFYGWLCLAWTPHNLLALLVMTLGNAAGGMMFPLAQKIFPHKASL